VHKKRGGCSRTEEVYLVDILGVRRRRPATLANAMTVGLPSIKRHLTKRLLNQSFEGSHNAGNDALATAKVFLALMQMAYERGVQMRPVADVVLVICDTVWVLGDKPKAKRVTEVGVTSFDSRTLLIHVPILRYRPDEMVRLFRPEHLVNKEFQDYFNPGFFKSDGDRG